MPGDAEPGSGGVHARREEWTAGDGGVGVRAHTGDPGPDAAHDAGPRPGDHHVDRAADRHELPLEPTGPVQRRGRRRGGEDHPALGAARLDGGAARAARPDVERLDEPLPLQCRRRRGRSLQPRRLLGQPQPQLRELELRQQGQRDGLRGRARRRWGERAVSVRVHRHRPEHQRRLHPLGPPAARLQVRRPACRLRRRQQQHGPRLGGHRPLLGWQHHHRLRHREPGRAADRSDAGPCQHDRGRHVRRPERPGRGRTPGRGLRRLRRHHRWSAGHGRAGRPGHGHRHRTQPQPVANGAEVMHATRRALSVPAVRLSWRRGLSLALAAGLMSLLVGDRARAITANPGIDPLAILDLQVKPNVLFIIDTSGTMKWPPDTDNFSVGDDDPSSRIFQAKQAVDTVVQANAAKMNFGLATYNILDSNKTLNRSAPNADFDGDGFVDGPLIYVSKDANAGQWLGTATTPASVSGTGYFNDPSDNFGPLGTKPYSPQTSYGIFNSFMNTNGTRIAATFGYANAYPPACTPGTTCRYYIQSKLFRDGVRYQWNRASATRSAGLVSSVPIPGGCPLPPAGLTGFNPDANGDGLADSPRPCFQLQDAATLNVSTYYYTSPLFQAVAGQKGCGGAAVLNTVALFGGDNSAAVSAKMGAAAPVDASGNVIGFPAAVTATQLIATDLTGGFNIPVAAFRAIQAPGQRNFVILVTDGDDSCAGGTLDQNAVTAAKSAQNLYDTFYGLNGQTKDFQHGAETMIIGFASQVTPARINVIAQGGSGATINTSNPPATAATCPAGVTPTPTCRNAFTAQNTAQLVNALNQALNQVQSSGTFSDQQSITESVFELGGT